MTRRKTFITSAAALLGAPLLPGCTKGGPDSNYAAAVSRIWQPLIAPEPALAPATPLSSARQPSALAPGLARELVR